MHNSPPHSVDPLATERPFIQVAVAVVEQAGYYLIGRRPSGVPLAGYWEFPGGKVRRGESGTEAAARECLEETGVAVHVGARLQSVSHEYSHARIKLEFFACSPTEANPAPRAPFLWVAREDLPHYRFPEANAELLAQLS